MNLIHIPEQQEDDNDLQAVKVGDLSSVSACCSQFYREHRDEVSSVKQNVEIIKSKAEHGCDDALSSWRLKGLGQGRKTYLLRWWRRSCPAEAREGQEAARENGFDRWSACKAGLTAFAEEAYACVTSSQRGKRRCP